MVSKVLNCSQHYLLKFNLLLQVCKNQNCKHEFCWVCLGAWEPHGSSWYNCNRYDEDEARAARDAQEKLRSSLAR